MGFTFVQWENENNMSVVNEKQFVGTVELKGGTTVDISTGTNKGRVAIYKATILKVCDVWDLRLPGKVIGALGWSSNDLIETRDSIETRSVQLTRRFDFPVRQPPADPARRRALLNSSLALRSDLKGLWLLRIPLSIYQFDDQV
ncbi:hypothetical protein pdam_00015334 [Pocillopora damicornis]|uniref:Uncharacterized protein n=1 Tax=Pocillopora damicornis TaxID=46731 RepID=A0A3M6UKY3_POCDA|nr:hypothetical protein pdam_00015334 [Pocillopora damicornis]